MKFKDIKEAGFYCKQIDPDEFVIYEVLNNTDTEWLKDDPDCKFLVDKWLYNYTDSDDRKVYQTSGTLNRLDWYDDNDVDLVKLDKEYDEDVVTLREAKITYKEQCQSLQSKINEVLNLCRTNTNEIAKEIEKILNA